MPSLRLNGRSHEIAEADCDTPLAYILRAPRIGDLTPKLGCGKEQCGACRVLVDGQPAYACTLRTSDALDRDIETAAGLDTGVRLALFDANATQCGFCLPGIIVAAEALFRANGQPTRADIAEALKSQLCRCGSHPRVLEALEAFSQGWRLPPGEVSTRSHIEPPSPPDELPPGLVATPTLTDWIRFDVDGRVQALTGKVDIGQGITNALRLIVGEELGLPPATVDVITAHTGRTPNEGATAGSMSIETSGANLRQASAWARRLLRERAAEAFGVPPERIETRSGALTAPGINMRLDYWQLSIALEGFQIRSRTAEKAPDRYFTVGSGYSLRFDIPAKATTGAFVHDLAADYHARVVRPPSLHHRLTRLDATVDPPGVLVIDGSFVAVAHPVEYEAERLRERAANAAEWHRLPMAPVDPGIDQPRRDAAEAFPLRDCTPTRARALPMQTMHRATYTRPFLMHGSIGPSAARAQWSDGRLRIDCASQAVEALPGVLARVLALDAERIEVRHVPGAGCYGHNGADDAALDAALVARALPRRRVLLKWTREDEHGFEPLGPAMRVDLGADFDADGHVTTWHHETTSFTHVARPSPGAPGVDLLAARWLAEPLAPSQPTPRLAPEVGIHRNALPLYWFANKHVVKRLLPDDAIRTSALRGLGAHGNVFAIESFMDEIALAAGRSPDQFRLDLLLHDFPARAVLRAALDLAGGLEGNRGVGIARYKNRQCCAAVVAEVEVDMDTAQVRATHLWIAADAGRVIDGDGLRNQLEGGAVQALSWCLKEAVAFDPYGRVESRDWDSYPILRFDEAPRVETVLLDHPAFPPLGAGEATVGPTAAALANAVFKATGLRVRDLPLTPDRLRAAAAQ